MTYKHGWEVHQYLFMTVLMQVSFIVYWMKYSLMLPSLPKGINFFSPMCSYIPRYNFGKFQPIFEATRERVWGKRVKPSGLVFIWWIFNLQLCNLCWLQLWCIVFRWVRNKKCGKCFLAHSWESDCESMFWCWLYQAYFVVFTSTCWTGSL